MLASLFACDKDKKEEPKGAKIESISFKQESYSVEAHQTDGLNLRGELKIAPAVMADTCKVTWALSNTEVASISKDGVITPKKVGETTVTATVQGKSAQCKYSVKETVITKVTLKNAEVTVGGKVTLEYTTEPVIVPVERLTFTSGSTTIATVDAKGEVTGVKLGTVSITAKCGTADGTCTVAVVPATVESVGIKPITATIAKGESKQYKAWVEPAEAESEFLIYEWKSSNTSVATVDENGLVTAKAVGTADITVSVSGKRATSKLKVEDNVIHVTSVSVNPSSIREKYVAGYTKSLTATVMPTDATDKTVTWTSSNRDVAAVDNDGIVYCRGLGTATITATADGKSGTCTVEFTKVPVTSVTVTPSTYTAQAKVGKEMTQLSATVSPSDATVNKVTWTSSNTNVATVSSTGVIICRGVGTSTITAACDGKSGTCKVEFQPVHVQSITLSPDPYDTDARAGAVHPVRATILPSDATEKTLTWKSSNTNIATVDNDGVVTSKGVVGSVTITATADGKSGMCTINYKKVPVQKVTVTPATYTETVSVGSTYQITASLYPEYSTEKTISWSSSNTSVATVSSTGLVTCKGVGTATITAKADGKSGTCTITYNAQIIRVQSVSLSETSIKVWTAGPSGMGSRKLYATVTPSDATYKTVTWSSSNASIAEVTEFGNVIGKREGTCTITATADGKSATCAVTVDGAKYIQDCEGNWYLTVKIGRRWWMAENLRCKTYDTQSGRSGAQLKKYSSTMSEYDPYYLDASNESDWKESEYAHYLTDTDKPKLGYVYTWAAAVGLSSGAAAKAQTTNFVGTRQGVCPNGWHMPYREEWDFLAEDVGGATSGGHYLKSKTSWYPNGDNIGIDSYYYCALPAGYGTHNGVSYVGRSACFWMSRAAGELDASGVLFEYRTKEMYTTSIYGKDKLLSVRCVKD